MISIAEPCRWSRTRPTSCGVETPASVGAAEGERFVLDAALHRRVGRLDLVPAQPDGSVEAREIVGAAIVGSTQLHEQHRAVASGSAQYESDSVGVPRLANGAQPGDDALEAPATSSRVSGARFGAPNTTSASDPDDDADRDREHDVERTGRRRQRAQQHEQHDRAPERALPLPAEPDARQA